MSAHNAAVLQEKAGAEVRSVSQKDNVLGTVRRDICDVEDRVHLVGANAGYESHQRDPSTVLVGDRFELVTSEKG